MTDPRVRIARRTTVEDRGYVTPCWILSGAQRNGYAVIRYGGRVVQAHRLAYEVYVGPIPEGLQLDHLCRQRACANPAHLEPVTPRENTLRGESISAGYAKRTHCKHGHELTSENVYTYPTGNARACRTCHREYQRRYSP